MSDHWEFYFCKINDHIASVFLDVGLRQFVPDPEQPWFLWLDVRLNNPRDDGLPGPGDFEPLKTIETSLVEAIEESIGARFVGRISTDGRRTIYFYGPSFAGFEDAALRTMAEFPAFGGEPGSEFDPEWRQYLKGLYPSNGDWRRIKNLHVIEQLEQHGDSLTKSRTVSHWLYFPTETARSEFKTDIVDKGFVIVNERTCVRNNGGGDFGIMLERVDFVDWDSINAVTLELMTLAENRGGDYDGWETQVLKTE